MQDLIYRRFFEQTDPEMTTAQVILWWELRRIPYNFAVGLAGILSIGILILAGSFRTVPPGTDLGEPFLMVIAIPLYGIAANICYTIGWAIQLRDREADPAKAALNASKLFKRGFLFSVLFTLLGPTTIILLVGLLIYLITNLFA